MNVLISLVFYLTDANLGKDESLSTSNFCSKCGAKLKTGAKFCTTCGSKQNPVVKEKLETKQDFYNTTRSFKDNSYHDEDVFYAKSSESSQSSKNTGGITLTSILSLEVEVESISADLYLKESLNQATVYYEQNTNSIQNVLTQFSQYIDNQKESVSFLGKTSWIQLKNLKTEMNVNEKFTEYDVILYSGIKSVLDQNKTYFSDQTYKLRNDNSTDSLKRDVDTKQRSLEQLHGKFFKGITNYNQYTKAITNLNYFQAKSLELSTNLYFLDEIQNKSDLVVEQIDTIKMAIDYNISSIFSYNSIIPIQNSDFEKIIINCSSIQNLIQEIQIYSNQIKFNISINFYENIGYLILESLLTDFFYNPNFSNTSKLLTKFREIYKNFNTDLTTLIENISSQQNALKNSIKTMKDVILKMRQEYLMSAVVRTKLPSKVDLPNTEKNSLKLNILTDYNSNFEVISLVKEQKFAKRQISISYLASKRESDKGKDSTNNSNSMSYDFLQNVDTSQLNESIFKIKMPKLPKLTSMDSLYLINENENPIKSELQNISYLFKKIRFDSNYYAECTYNTGSIKTLTWDFPDDSGTIVVQAFLNITFKHSPYFSLKQNNKRDKYQWEDPYSQISIEVNDDDTKKKLMRERRIAEKLKMIPGSVTAEIQDTLITLQIEKNKDTIRPTVDFLQELTFILNVSFRF